MLDALKKAIEYYGNISQLAKEMGVAHSTILFWMSGKTKSISGLMWRSKIGPVLIPFMDEKALQKTMMPQHMVMASEPSSSYKFGSPQIHLSTPLPQESKVIEIIENHSADTISFDQLDEFDPMFHKIAFFAKEKSCGKISFASVMQNGFFGVNLIPEKEFLSPADNLCILVAGDELAKNGDLVIAKLRETGEIVIRTYERDKDCIRLLPYKGKKGPNIVEWDNRKSPGFLFWMFPIVEANIQLRPIGNPNKK